jgi:hypothetical protein
MPAAADDRDFHFNIACVGLRARMISMLQISSHQPQRQQTNRDFSNDSRCHHPACAT